MTQPQFVWCDATGTGRNVFVLFRRSFTLQGDPADSVPGRLIVIPERPEQIRAKDFDLAKMRRSYVRNALQHAPEGYVPTDEDIEFLAVDTNSDAASVEAIVSELAKGAQAT